MSRSYGEWNAQDSAVRLRAARLENVSKSEAERLFIAMENCGAIVHVEDGMRSKTTKSVNKRVLKRGRGESEKKKKKSTGRRRAVTSSSDTMESFNSSDEATSYDESDTFRVNLVPRSSSRSVDATATVERVRVLTAVFHTAYHLQCFVGASNVFRQFYDTSGKRCVEVNPSLFYLTKVFLVLGLVLQRTFRYTRREQNSNPWGLRTKI